MYHHVIPCQMLPYPDGTQQNMARQYIKLYDSSMEQITCQIRFLLLNLLST